MAAHGNDEIESTLARAATLAGGRVFESALPDDDEPPRTPDGRLLPHIIMDFGATVRTMRDRNIANAEKGQPHVLPLNVACVAGDADSARLLRKEVFDLLVDWSPSDTSDPWRAQGGYGGNRSATANTPTRFIAGSFYECVVNQDGHT